VDVKTGRATRKEKYTIQPCPNCGVKQKITKPLEEFFPYQNCKSCEQAFYVNKDLTVRQLTEEEKEDMPAAWVQIVEDLSKKKLAIVFRLE
jgi:ssDNA-binding Zn-finger/Zn-ribbon topoisomerase 1